MSLMNNPARFARLLCIVGIHVLLFVPVLHLEAQTERSITPARVETAPNLGGQIDGSWEGAVTISDFKQREPYEGKPATEKTLVKIAYDKHNLYFAIYCYDSSPKGISATELRRDADYTVDD